MNLELEKKDINEKRIDFIQREKSCDFQSSGNICNEMNAKTFFVVYTLGLDARVLTGKYQMKNFENFRNLQKLKNSLQRIKTQLIPDEKICIQK